MKKGANTLEYKGFIGSVEFSNEDDCLFGEILGISDLVTYEAKDVEGLKAAFHDMVEDYIKTCEMVGKDPEKSYRGVFNVRVTPKLHQEAARAASVRGITLNKFVGYALDQVLHHAQ